MPEPIDGKEQEPSSPPAGVNAGVKDGDKDEKGVPWKNRAEEFKRKFEDAAKDMDAMKTRMAEYEAYLQSLPKQGRGNEDADPTDDEYIKGKEAKQIAQRAAEQTMRNMTQANSVAENALDKMQQDSTLGKYVQRYRAEIMKEVSGYDPKVRSSAGNIEFIAKYVIGGKLGELESEFSKGNGKELLGGAPSDVLAPSGGTGNAVGDLTKEESEFSAKTGITDVGRIKAHFKRRKAIKEEIGKQKR